MSVEQTAELPNCGIAEFQIVPIRQFSISQFGNQQKAPRWHEGPVAADGQER
jgi:hypothetical protein